MQNRYAGDIGDFGKFGLLKILSEYLKVGVNWYLIDTPEGELQGAAANDGRHTAYLCRETSALYQCAPDVAEKLKPIARAKDPTNRNICLLEKILPNVTYFSEVLERDSRDEWFEQSLSALKECDIIFADADNGFEVKSMTAGKSIKYLLASEIKRYYKDGHSVFFYNHRSRQAKEKYIAQFERILNNSHFKDAAKFAITFHPYSVCDYIFIVHPKHTEKTNAAMSKFKESHWWHPKRFDELIIASAAA